MTATVPFSTFSTRDPPGVVPPLVPWMMVVSWPPPVMVTVCPPLMSIWPPKAESTL